ncbi:MAG: hypothetical protein CML56_06865, partial [Rhodobacteraceae bacterium]|nr:hypothetical protein [Paracoccaceae bacterium]
YSEAAVGGSEVARQMINALATNHLVDFMLGQYLKLVANIETSEDIFQINGTGFGSFPDPLTTDIYTAFIGSIENRIPISSADASRKIDYLKRMCEISYPFANENYRDRCINSTSFDRVFNLIIDEDSFESYTLKPGYYEASVSEESSGEIGTAIGPTSTFSFTPGSGLIPQRSSNTELEASYSDYYITVEVVQPIRSDPLAPSIGYSDSSVSPGYDAGDETPGEDALDGGLFEKGPQKDKEILTPPEMNLEQKGLGGGPMADIEDAAIQQGIDDMMEKIQPWLDDMTSGNMGAIKDMFERSVVCPKGLPGSEETDDIINNMRNFGAETLENLLGDFLNNGAGLTGTDILMNVQDSVLNVLGAEGSIVDGIFDPRAGLTDVTGDIGSTLDINPAENLADTGMSSASDMLRGLTTQIDSIADGLMSGVPGIDAGILENDLAQGMTGLGASMDASVNLSAGATAAGVAGVESAVTQDYFGIDSNLSAKELSYGVSMEMMNSAQGLSNIGNAISSGVNAGEMMLGMDMFQLHGVNSYNNFQMVF